MVVAMGFEPMKHDACELESHPVDRTWVHYLILCREILFLPFNLLKKIARCGTRTHDHKIKSLALYQLS